MCVRLAVTRPQRWPFPCQDKHWLPKQQPLLHALVSVVTNQNHSLVAVRRRGGRWLFQLNTEIKSGARCSTTGNRCVLRSAREECDNIKNIHGRSAPLKKKCYFEMITTAKAVERLHCHNTTVLVTSCVLLTLVLFPYCLGSHSPPLPCGCGMLFMPFLSCVIWSLGEYSVRRTGQAVPGGLLTPGGQGQLIRGGGG